VTRNLGALAALAALAAAGLACAHPQETAAGGEWSFPEYELTLRLPERWVVEDAVAIYARQSGIPEAEVRAVPLADLVRRTRLLLMARPGAESGASPQCVVMVQIEDLTRFPGVDSAEKYAALAEQAVKRHLPGYELVRLDVPVRAGSVSGIRRECKAAQVLGGESRTVRNATLFLKRESLGFAVGAYELEEQFESRRADFETILSSVRMGSPQAEGAWARLGRWLSGAGCSTRRKSRRRRRLPGPGSG
jgi:hypothetical protein